MIPSAAIQFRKSYRAKDFDYRSNEAYFVTICVRDREHVFGSIVNNATNSSQRGIVARDCWLDLSSHHPHVELDAFVIMPNHVHGILLFTGNQVVATPASRQGRTGLLAGSLGAVVGSYKSAVTRKINQFRAGAATNLWQTSYHDHIIRSHGAFERIRDYINSNPARWGEDEENLAGSRTDGLDQFIASLGDVAGHAATQASPLQKGGE